MSKIFCGLDLSLTSPGFTILDESGEIVRLMYLTEKKKYEGSLHDKLFGETYPIYRTDVERYEAIAKLIIKQIEPYLGNTEIHMVMEGYAFGASGSRLFQIAENGGVCKYLLSKVGVEPEIVPPTTIKKLATGKGNSPKEPVVEAFTTATGLNLKDIFGLKTDKAVSPISDIADSYWMARYCREKVNGNI